MINVSFSSSLLVSIILKKLTEINIIRYWHPYSQIDFCFRWTILWLFSILIERLRIPLKVHFRLMLLLYVFVSIYHYGWIQCRRYLRVLDRICLSPSKKNILLLFLLKLRWWWYPKLWLYLRRKIKPQFRLLN